MINFRKFIEFIFKSFNISGDTKLIEKLEKDGIRFLIIVKRHWIFGILNSWRVFFVLIIAFINSYLLIFSNEKHTIISTIIGIFLLINVFYWVIIICIYLYNFYHIQGSEPYIEDIYSCLKKSHDNDEIFTKFFNQTLFLLLVLTLITIFIIFTTISNFAIGGGGTTSFGFGSINAVLILFQLGLFVGYLKSMLNQEMDFNVIIPGQILFYNQKGVLGDSQSMNSEKIKTINTKYSGLFGSFFNYGDIIILSEGDSKNNGEMIMDYIGNPTKTVKEIQKVLNNDLNIIEKEVNLVLKKFKNEIGINNDINLGENKKKLKDFLQNNEQKIKELFEKGTSESKEEIKELYILINK